MCYETCWIRTCHLLCYFLKYLQVNMRDSRRKLEFCQEISKNLFIEKFWNIHFPIVSRYMKQIPVVFSNFTIWRLNRMREISRFSNCKARNSNFSETLWLFRLGFFSEWNIIETFRFFLNRSIFLFISEEVHSYCIRFFERTF